MSFGLPIHSPLNRPSCSLVPIATKDEISGCTDLPRNDKVSNEEEFNVGFKPYKTKFMLTQQIVLHRSLTEMKTFLHFLNSTPQARLFAPLHPMCL
jgi:hypothetical protein